MGIFSAFQQAGVIGKLKAYKNIGAPNTKMGGTVFKDFGRGMGFLGLRGLVKKGKKGTGKFNPKYIK